MPDGALWILSHTDNPRFPYRIEILSGSERVIALWVQDKWPGSGKQIFCLREGQMEEPESPFREIERVPVVRLDRFGKQLSVILDRPNRKRCNFLFLEKRYKNRPGSYEQIFFRTQSGMQQHRSNSRVQLHSHGAYRILIDSGERYPWRFRGAPSERRRLAAGDYALEVATEIAAVVERKTFDNILSDFGSIRVLHARLDDLSRFSHAAMVIEAQYRDFLDPRKLNGRWPASHAARVLAELHVLHPQLQIIYAGSRTSAQQWCEAWFAGRARELWHRAQDERSEQNPDEPSGNRSTLEVGEPPTLYAPVSSAADSSHQLRHTILTDETLSDPFTIEDLRQRFPHLPDGRIRSMLQTLKIAGQIERHGSGRAARWHRRTPRPGKDSNDRPEASPATGSAPD